MNKEILFWNVDTQIDFIDSKGKLPVPGAEEIKATLFRLTMFARNNRIQVVNTCDWHDENTEEISSEPDFVNTFPEHCMSHTRGALFISETTPNNPYVVDFMDNDVFNPSEASRYRNIIIRKDKFDVFEGNPETNDVLNSLPQNTVVVYGVAENVCVDFAVKGLLERGKEVYVISDAIKGLPGIDSPQESWKEAGAKIVKFEELDVLFGLMKTA
jgi:nicotinamidase/pyrazinamidase